MSNGGKGGGIGERNGRKEKGTYMEEKGEGM